MDIPAPKELRKPIVIPSKLLMGPGPSNCPPRVLHALSQPVLGHLHPECLKYMDEIKEGIKYVFQTRNELTLALSTSGHGGMEAVMCNLLEDGNKVLVAVNGIWGSRAVNMAHRYGAVVYTIEAKLGDNFSLAEIEQAIAKYEPKLFFVTQGESSTGVYQPIEGIGDICHRYNCLLAVDSVASLGGVPMFADRWGVDAIYTGSQKVIGAPAGLTPISFSPRAQKAIFNRKTPIKVFYWDMTVICDYWNCFNKPRIYHHTISSTLVYGLREGLAIIAEERLCSVIRRHEECAQRLYAGLQRLGLQLLVEDEEKRLPTVTAIRVPDNVDWKKIIEYCMKRYSLEISGGLGPTANLILRVGLMGHNATFENVDLVLQALEGALEYARYGKNKL